MTEDFDVDFEDIGNFDIDEILNLSELCLTAEVKEEEIYEAKRYKRPKFVKYEYAEAAAKNIRADNDGDVVHVIVSGNFIFGDFIEAFVVENNYLCEELIVATLSLSQENVDSFLNLINGDYVKKMSLLVSDYWFSHERYNGAKYICDHMEENVINFAVAGVHTKVVLIKTQCGKHFVLHGSANLRASRNLEQFCLENEKGLYDFHKSWINPLVDEYKVDKKSKRSKELWQNLTEQGKQGG